MNNQSNSSNNVLNAVLLLIQDMDQDSLQSLKTEIEVKLRRK